MNALQTCSQPCGKNGQTALPTSTLCYLAGKTLSLGRCTQAAIPPCEVPRSNQRTISTQVQSEKPMALFLNHKAYVGGYLEEPESPQSCRTEELEPQVSVQEPPLPMKNDNSHSWSLLQQVTAILRKMTVVKRRGGPLEHGPTSDAHLSRRAWLSEIQSTPSYRKFSRLPWY